MLYLDMRSILTVIPIPIRLMLIDFSSFHRLALRNVLLFGQNPDMRL